MASETDQSSWDPYFSVIAKVNQVEPLYTRSRLFDFQRVAIIKILTKCSSNLTRIRVACFAIPHDWDKAKLPTQNSIFLQITSEKGCPDVLMWKLGRDAEVCLSDVNKGARNFPPASDYVCLVLGYKPRRFCSHFDGEHYLCNNPINNG